MSRRRDWTEFKATAPRIIPKALYVSLTKKGYFVFNTETFLQLGKPEAVVLLFDRRDDLIGLKPSTLDVPNAIVVRLRYDRGNLWMVRSLRFMKQHDIRLDYTIQFPTAHMEDGILVLPIRQRIPCYKMRWKPMKD